MYLNTDINFLNSHSLLQKQLRSIYGYISVNDLSMLWTKNQNKLRIEMVKMGKDATKFNYALKVKHDGVSHEGR